MSAQHPLVTQLVSAMRLARTYMSDAVEYEMPCAKKDAATVDEAIEAASIAQMLAAKGEEMRQCLREFLAVKDWLAGDDFDPPEPQIRERLDHAAATARLLLEGHAAEQPVAQAGVLEGWQPIETAPKDGTQVLLLVEFDDHSTEDVAGPARTIGANNDDNVGEDEREGWQFAGWCWNHDHYTQGTGKAIAWQPMPSPLAAETTPSKEGEW